MNKNIRNNNHYKTLGINSNASDDDIKKAYKQMCLKWHPDKAPQNDKKKKEEFDKMFKNIKEAYNILSNPSKRDAYDNPYDDIDDSNGINFDKYSKGSRKKEFTFGAGGMNDLFSAFFGSSATSNEKSNNTNSFSSSKNNGFNSKEFEKAFDIPFFKNNSKFNNNTNSCKKTYEKDSELSDNTESSEESISKSENTKDILNCTVNDLCNGALVEFSYKRKIKKGNRLVNKKEKITVEIPIDHDPSEPIIIDNMGSVLHKNMDAGDLELSLNVQPYKGFEMIGNNLYYTANISIKKAISGFTKTIECLDGDKVQLTVPPMKSSKKDIVIEGKGLNGNDLIINFDVDFTYLFGQESDDNDSDGENNDNENKKTKKPKKKTNKK